MSMDRRGKGCSPQTPWTFFCSKEGTRQGSMRGMLDSRGNLKPEILEGHKKLCLQFHCDPKQKVSCEETPDVILGLKVLGGLLFSLFRLLEQTIGWHVICAIFFMEY